MSPIMNLILLHSVSYNNNYLQKKFSWNRQAIIKRDNFPPINNLIEHLELSTICGVFHNLCKSVLQQQLLKEIQK